MNSERGSEEQPNPDKKPPLEPILGVKPVSEKEKPVSDRDKGSGSTAEASVKLREEQSQEEIGEGFKSKKILLEKKDSLADLQEEIQDAQSKGNKEEEKALLTRKEELSKEINVLCEKITGESLYDNIDKKLKGMKLEGVTTKEKTRRESLKAEKDIKEEEYKKVKEICLKELPEKVRRIYENDDEAFKKYLGDKKNANKIENDAYFRLIANGIRVDSVKEKRNFFKANGIEVPIENGKSIYFNSEDEFVNWAKEQEKETKYNIKDEAKKRAGVKLKNADGSERKSDDIKEELKGEQKEKAIRALWNIFQDQGGKSDDFNNYLDRQVKVLGITEDEFYMMVNAGYIVKEGRSGAKKMSLDGKGFTACNNEDFKKVIEQVKSKTQKNIDNESVKRERMIVERGKSKETFRQAKKECSDELFKKAVGEEEAKETSERLHKKLDREIKQFRKDVPPIGKEPFDPKSKFEEFKGINKDYRKGRAGKENLNIFKESLIKQQEALALCRNFIEREIENNPDIPKDKFVEWKDNIVKWIGEFGKDYGFTDGQKSEAEACINKYKNQQEKAKKLVFEDFKDNKKGLIEQLTGKTTGNLNLTQEDIEGVKVSVDKMSVIIEANKDIVDKLSTKDAEPIGFKLGGFHYIKDGIDYIVINQETVAAGKVKEHEFQHAKNAIFGKMFRKLGIATEKEKYESAKDSKMDMITAAAEIEEVNKYEAKEKEFLEKYLRAEQKYALGRVKNEFIASLHDIGLVGLKEKWEETFLKKEPDNTYDYLKKIRESGEYKINPDLSKKIFEEEYKKIIGNAIGTFSDLVDKNKGGYSIEKAIDFLTYVDLEFWPANVRRLLKNKENKDEEKKEEKKAVQKKPRLIRILERDKVNKKK